MKCQFTDTWNKECDMKCKYFNTCTRNPHNKKGQKDDKRKSDRSNR